MIEDIRNEIGYEPINSKTLIKYNNRPISHPYYVEYEELRIICIKILRDEGISIWDESKEFTKSILFYVPDLWELFLEDKIKADSRITNEVYPQGTTPFGDKKVNVYGKKDAKDNQDFELSTYPDYVFFDVETEEKLPYCILDAKFRKGIGSKKGFGVDIDDYTKCIRDMNSIDAHATGVIFPLKLLDGIDEDSIIHSISKYNDRDVFFTFPLLIPEEKENGKDKKYSEWKREFDSCTQKTINMIIKYLSAEREYARKVRNYMSNYPDRQKMEFESAE